MSSTWIIVYPGGNRRRLAVVEICHGLEYEKADYDIASRQEFYDDEAGANEHARKLGAEHGLDVESDQPAYLD